MNKLLAAKVRLYLAIGNNFCMALFNKRSDGYCFLCRIYYLCP